MDTLFILEVRPIFGEEVRIGKDAGVISRAGAWVAVGVRIETGCDVGGTGNVRVGNMGATGILLPHAASAKTMAIVNESFNNIENISIFQ
jgi:hypothetical protein